MKLLQKLLVCESAEGKRIDNNVDISHSSPSVDNSEKAHDDESYVSSVKTVALWVNTYLLI